MNTQPYALKVADLLDDELRRSVKLNTLYTHAAAELRRLHEVNVELVGALMAVMDLGGTSLQLIYESREAADKAKAALAKAQGENND